MIENKDLAIPLKLALMSSGVTEDPDIAEKFAWAIINNYWFSSIQQYFWNQGYDAHINNSKYQGNSCKGCNKPLRTFCNDCAEIQ